MRRTSGVLAGLPLAFALSAPAAVNTPPYVQVPVVMDVRGNNGSHFTSDLTVANLGALASDIELTFVGTYGPSAGPYLLGTTLLPNRQATFGDVVAFLRTLGAPFTDGEQIIGTLLVRLPGGDSTAPFVGSRVTTPAPAGGSYGTYSIGVPVGSGLTGTSTIFGLRENAAFRSNLGLVHAGGGQLKDVSLSIQIWNGDTGQPAGDPIAVTLGPGEWLQLSSILSYAGVSQGWVKISQTAGTDHYIAYAVVNDGGVGMGGTSDGSWIDANAAEGTIPIVLTSDPYKTELVLARPTGGTTSTFATLVYESSLGADNLGGQIHVSMPANTQMIIPDVIDFLRQQGLGIPAGSGQGGTLKVTGALAYARVWSPNPDTTVGGTFGVAFPAIPSTARADAEAWVFGLRQDGFVRSNLAIVNALNAGTSPCNYVIDFYDGPSGRNVLTRTKNLGGGQWYQLNAPLTNLNVRQGYARVRCTNPAGGTCDFAVYGVINDGSSPSVGTSDGSYIPMTRVQ